MLPCMHRAGPKTAPHLRALLLDALLGISASYHTLAGVFCGATPPSRNCLHTHMTALTESVVATVEDGGFFGAMGANDDIIRNANTRFGRLTRRRRSADVNACHIRITHTVAIVAAQRSRRVCAICRHTTVTLKRAASPSHLPRCCRSCVCGLSIRSLLCVHGVTIYRRKLFPSK